MSNYDNTDTGALFKNDKRGNDKAPDYTGEIYDAGGNKRRIAAWLRESKSGNKYMSLKVEDFRPQSGTDRPQTEQPKDYPQDTGGGGFDDIPFAPVDWRAP